METKNGSLQEKKEVAGDTEATSLHFSSFKNILGWDRSDSKHRATSLGRMLLLSRHQYRCDSKIISTVDFIYGCSSGINLKGGLI